MHGCCIASGIHGLLTRHMGYVGLPPTVGCDHRDWCNVLGWVLGDWPLCAGVMCRVLNVANGVCISAHSCAHHASLLPAVASHVGQQAFIQYMGQGH